MYAPNQDGFGSLVSYYEALTEFCLGVAFLLEQ
jgi:hypothetical protein